MSELMEKAMKEGISFDGEDQNEGQPSDAQIPGKDEQTAANGDNSVESQASQSAGGAAKSVEAEVKETSEPFHKHPKWQRMNEENRQYKERLERMESKYQELLESSLFKKQTDNSQQAPLNNEQRQSLLTLVNLIKSDPEAAQILGLGTVNQVQDAINSLQTEKITEGFWGEFDNTIDKYSSQYGLKADEIAEELQEFIATDPTFSQLPYTKGNVEIAAQVMLFGRIGELKEREINSKLIKDKQLKASQNTESSSKEVASGSKGIDLSMPGGIMQRIQQAGGLSV